MQLAASLTSTRLVVALVACSAAFGLYRAWPEPEVAPPPAAAPATYHLVPLSGEALQQLVDQHDGTDDQSPAQAGGGCVPFVPPLTAYKNWSLQLVEGASGCTGDWIHSVFEVASDGAVIWSAEDMAPRRLQLTGEEFAVITGMNSFDCVRTERIGYSSSWLRISPGGGEHRAHGGAVISQSSMLGILVDGVLTQAIDRYRRQRLAALRPFEMHLTTTGANGRTRYHLDLDGKGQLTVRLRGRELIGRRLEDDAVVDFLDRLLVQPLATPDPEDRPASGVLISAGVRLPVSISRWGAFNGSILWRTFDDVDVESGY